MAKKKKDPAAVARGRLGGLIGGPARAKRLTAAQRSRIARKAGAAGGKARAANMTARQRQESCRKAAKARAAQLRARAKCAGG